jgi:hypothetical protein
MPALPHKLHGFVEGRRIAGTGTLIALAMDTYKASENGVPVCTVRGGECYAESNQTPLPG